MPGGANDGRWNEPMPSVLLAYEGNGEGLRAETLTHIRCGRHALLDSGAFSAWRSGATRALPKYIEVCGALAPLGGVDGYASLAS